MVTIPFQMVEKDEKNTLTQAYAILQFSDAELADIRTYYDENKHRAETLLQELRKKTERNETL